jgi:Domain of unknown function (DUF1906)
MAGVVARSAVGVTAVALLASAAPAAPRRAAALYSGPGFDACSAPSLAKMQKWIASPYRAIGIYLGGINRACPDGNLSASWTATVVSQGWNLLPLYVGLQAPCVPQAGLALINPSTAAADGAAAADDAISRATTFGLTQGAPIYFDLEGYKLNSPPCTQAVQAFLGGWVTRLKSLGWLAGVYGSAASTIRDLIPSVGAATGPDAVWIADWNGQTGVFGDPYVADTYWPSHQRVHQYTGGHNETYGGVTINIDSNSVDAPVVGPGGAVAPAPPPPPQPQLQAGSVTSSDGQATVSWPSAALPGGTTVTATPVALPAAVDGFAAGSYVLQVAISPAATPAAPLTVTFHTPPPGVVPARSADGTAWTPLAATTATDGSLSVSSATAGSIGLLRDIAPPTSPRALTGHLVGGRLLLSWRPATDNSGSIASYEILRNGAALAASSAPGASVRGFAAQRPTVFRVTAVDAAANVSTPSAPVIVRPTKRPVSIPRQIPNWAFQLAAWQQASRAGKRPAAPQSVPSWYWRWQAWRLRPFRVA